MMSKDEKIQLQEKYYRNTLTHILTDLFRNYYITIQQMPTDCKVDMRLSAASTENNIECSYDIEIKERNFPEQYYKYSELKVDKYYNMLEEHKNKRLIYIVILNKHMMYLYDLDAIEMSELDTKEWEIKDVEYDDENTSTSIVKTFMIPTYLAQLKLDVSKYFSDANN